MKFRLGQVMATRDANHVMVEKDINPLHLLMRHGNGDWGDMCASDKRSNDEALIDGGRIFSAYDVGGVRLWVITESNRAVTTILLPEDY
jgi:hypothetical protein